MQQTSGPLSGVRVFDLSRILAGPSCTQLLGDLGADVIKVERPGAGDDTRQWGPPYVKDANGNDTTESAYYLSCNRNKRSLTLDVSQPQGQALARRLIAHCDVLVENFKVGGLAKYGLDYASLAADFPALVYCSITGFGQDGPYAERPGYDLMVQGMAGIMSITGPADGEPTKVGVAIADVMCGMYASVAILAALRARDRDGLGQFLDLSLVDSTVSWLVNQGLNYLTSGVAPKRAGNAHPNIVPYQVFSAADGHLILAVGNDSQFRRFCELAGAPELADDPRYSTNSARVAHREELVARVEALLAVRPRAYWLEGLERVGVPCGPVNTLDQVFADPQVRHRGMQVQVPHPLAGSGHVDLIGSPLRFSRTPVTLRRAPPTLGQHTDEVLEELLGMDADERARLRREGVI